MLVLVPVKQTHAIKRCSQLIWTLMTSSCPKMTQRNTSWKSSMCTRFVTYISHMPLSFMASHEFVLEHFWWPKGWKAEIQGQRSRAREVWWSTLSYWSVVRDRSLTANAFWMH